MTKSKDGSCAMRGKGAGEQSYHHQVPNIAALWIVAMMD